MEKITTLASGILDQLENLDPAIAAKIQLAVSEIVEEAYGLSNAFALAEKSVGNVNATSPAPAAAPEVASTADTVTTDVARADPNRRHAGQSYTRRRNHGSNRELTYGQKTHLENKAHGGPWFKNRPVCPQGLGQGISSPAHQIPHGQIVFDVVAGLSPPSKSCGLARWFNRQRAFLPGLHDHGF